MGTDLLAVILTGGGAAMLAAIVQAYRSLRDGSRAEDKDAFAEVETRARKADKRADRAETERDYWRRRAASLEFHLISIAGRAAMPELEPFPPEEPETTVEKA